jgi:hypothetical protein
MSDPFSRGSYSFAGVDTTEEDYTTLATPVSDTLFFAGEHTNTTHMATAHGALASGQRAAAEVAALYASGPRPSPIAATASGKPKSRLSRTSGWSLLAWGGASPADSTAGQQVVDVDLFGQAGQVASLKAKGHIVFCYYSAGTVEDWREDVIANKSAWQSVSGGAMAQWAGERWLDISKLDKLQALMVPRLDEAAAVGCDGVEPDNVDCFANAECTSKFLGITKMHQLAYNRWTASYAHSKGLLIGLKNTGTRTRSVQPRARLRSGATACTPVLVRPSAGSLVADLVSDYDCAFVEQCMQFTECPKYSPFISANKPVFAIEYQDSSSKCASANTLGIQLKWCAGSPANGVCSNNRLVNCYTYPTWSNVSSAVTTLKTRELTTLQPRTANGPTPSVTSKQMSAARSGVAVPAGFAFLILFAQFVIGIVASSRAASD